MSVFNLGSLNFQVQRLSSARPFLHEFVRNVRSVRLKNINDDTQKLENILTDFKRKQDAETLRHSPPSSKTSRSVNNDTITNINKSQMKTENVISSERVPILVTAENQYELLAERVTPLHNLPYEMQLKRKHSLNKAVLREFGMNLQKYGTEIPDGSNGMPCVLDYTIPSPVTEAYRNKDEFSIRTGVDGNPKTVGFFLDSTANNADTTCVPADRLVIIKDSHKALAKVFEEYIRKSPLAACHNFSDGGYWRNIIARSNSAGELMGIVVFHPQELTTEDIEMEKQKLKEHFMAKQQELNLKSFYFQACSHTRCTHAQAPFQLLFGEPFIVEEVNRLKYQISPESFFQVNTPAASLLYKLIVNTGKVKRTTTVLDICCGIGPISLSLAPHVKRCIGIDSSVQAIEDAKRNAEINGIKNVEFHAGRSERLLQDILNEIYVEELIAIVNPARSALAKTAMTALREYKYLKKVIFVSCKPTAAIPNFIQLCRPSISNRTWSAFHPIRAVPVDLFPHTLHSELLILFQRLS